MKKWMVWLSALLAVLLGVVLHLYLKPEKRSARHSREIPSLREAKKPKRTSRSSRKRRTRTRSSSSEDEQSVDTSDSEPDISTSSDIIKPSGEFVQRIFWGYLGLLDTVFFGHNHPQNRAVIKDLITSQKGRYSLNATLPYGSRVIKIMKDRVVLEKDGETRTFKLFVSLGNRAARKDFTARGYQQVAPNEWLIRPNRLLGKSENIENILSEVEFASVVDAKGIERFQLTQLKDDALVEELGIRDGDVITTINGKDISGIRDLLSVYQQTKGASLITIDMERNQNPIELSYRIVPDGKPSYNVENIINSFNIVKFVD